MTSESTQAAEHLADAVAVIGMSCRFPDARTPAEFWRNLQDGVESVRAFSAQDLVAAGVDPAIMRHPGYVNSGVVLEEVELFDAAFFGFSPRDAEILDPQQRLFLECAWQALEDAGYNPAACEGPVGVYGGADASAYLFNLYANPEVVQSVGAFAISLANDKDHLTTRVAYKLNLKGPAVTVQTTCSTSLVAVCQAVQSLLYYQCDMALAGGAAIALPQRVGYLYQEGGIASPDGHCRAFDAAARGTIGGSGAGVVVLKRYADAVADGDHIRAVVRGFGLNNDGSTKVGYTAPSVDGQAEAIATAQAMAGVDPETITYIEAHGTGTPLGDPIELSALTRVFRTGTTRTGFCGIGSVKTNFGHLNSAAGVAGLIKTVLALEHRLLPPSLHYQRPNPNIDFAGSPFYVVDRLRDWRANGVPRRAGVSSFGIGGTNAHVVVEEAPPAEPATDARPWQLVALSARSGSALDQATVELGRHLRAHPELALADVAYTLHVGREAFPHRRLLIVATDERDVAVDALEANDARRLLGGVRESAHRPVVFMFSGQGSQYVGMGRELYEREPAFREAMDRCADLLQPHLGLDLRTVVYGDGDAATAERLQQTAVTQPALFALEYAAAQLWIAWGVQPQALVGHSIGEYVAACLAGVLSLEDALALVAARGRLMQQMPGGAMLAVQQAEAELAPLLDFGLSLAAVNGPRLCVVSGPAETVAAAEASLERQSIGHTRLHTSHAFHSTMLDAVVEPFTQEVRRLRLQAPRIPYLSNVTGTWITAEQAMDPAYWGRHLRQTVRFARCIETLAENPKRILLEVGPGRTLGTFAMAQQGAGDPRLVLSSLPGARDPQGDLRTMLQALGRLWLAGVEVDWKSYHASERRRRVSLPTYPFERQRYWVDPVRSAPAARNAAVATHERADVGDWFYVPAWRPATERTAERTAERAATAAGQPLRWLLVGGGALGADLAVTLRTRGQEVLTASAGAAYRQLEERSFQLVPTDRAGYSALLRALKEAGRLPDRIVHLWSAREVEGADPGTGAGDGHDFASLLALAQAIAEHMPDRPAQLRVVARQAVAVTDAERVRPERAMLGGAARVIGQELPALTTQLLDVPDAVDAASVAAELAAEPVDAVVALRGGARLTPRFEPVRLEASQGRQRLRRQGVYLVTGGLGGIGLAIAEHLARTVQARLVLVGRTAPPPREQWERLAATADGGAAAATARALRELERRGAEVMIATVDVTDRAAMRDLAGRVVQRFGALHGIVHSAGVAGGGIIQLKTMEQARRVMAPKVEGARVLAEVFGEAPALDFVVLCSSLSAQLGGVGQIDYSAANCFLDAFAHDNPFRRRGVRTLSVDWDTWAEVGMAVNTEVPEALQQARREGLRRGILTREGMEAFERALGASVAQVAVSTVDLPLRIREATAPRASRTAPAAAAAPAPSPRSAAHARPNLASEYQAPRTRTEEVIAGIWEELLGIRQVGVNDSFLELGGHSLLAIQLISRIRDAFRFEVSVQQLFDDPTVAGLAALVGGAPAPAPPAGGTTPVLARLPRERYRGRISESGVVELPEALQPRPTGPLMDGA